MSRPLLPRRDAQSAAARFHREVFATYGYRCILCGVQATDAAHVIGRGMRLGPLRYANVRLARPLCRSCHDRIDGRRFPKRVWPKAILRDAIRAHNETAKQKLQEPA